MKTRVLLLLLVVVALMGGCQKAGSADETLGPGDLAKWNDPRFEIIGVGMYNYTSYDIFGLLILPPDKNSIEFAAHGFGSRATPRNAVEWVPSGGGASLAWDIRWTAPRKFKVWWFRVVDAEAYHKSGGGYDKYTMKHTEPGAAWCEGEIEVTRAPASNKIAGLTVHIYPDGHIEGDVVASSEDLPRVDIKRRDELPILRDRPCLKEVPNPYFGRKKPIQMN